MIDPLALARTLIDIPSTTGDEAAVATYLGEELTALGYETRRHWVADSRFNVAAFAGGRPRVIFNSHLDTVPPSFPSRDDGDQIRGRGACDAKGMIAAMVSAGELLRSVGIRDFGFLFVVGEETDSIGAKMANVEFGGLGSEYVIVGEPTESTFARASKGALTCTVRFEGIAAHSAYPHLGDSAIRRMAAAIAAIEVEPWGDDPELGATTANVGVVRGGEKANIIPSWAEFDCIFRLVTTPDEVRDHLARVVALHGGTIVKSHGNPPQRMIVPDGAPSTVVAFNTDVPHLSALGKPLLFGPGSILDAHGADERIGKRDLLNAVETYARTVETLLRS